MRYIIGGIIFLFLLPFIFCWRALECEECGEDMEFYDDRRSYCVNRGCEEFNKVKK